MLVIGVAEPDNGAADAAEAAAKRKHIEFENQLGSWLFHASNILDGAIVWGVNGMRQRVLVRSSKCIQQGLNTDFCCVALQTIRFSVLRRFTALG